MSRGCSHAPPKRTIRSSLNPCPASQVGDVLLAAAFVSYAAPFNMQLREQLVDARWVPDLASRGIAMTAGAKPLDLLADGPARAKWANEGLPIDPLSVENGAIMNAASRWSLMIDPQLQVGAGHGGCAASWGRQEGRRWAMVEAAA